MITTRLKRKGKEVKVVLIETLIERESLLKLSLSENKIDKGFLAGQLNYSRRPEAKTLRPFSWHTSVNFKEKEHSTKVGHVLITFHEDMKLQGLNLA